MKGIWKKPINQRKNNMENSSQYITANEARQIATAKIEIYNQECEIKAQQLLEIAISQVEKAANNKLMKIEYYEAMSGQTCMCLCRKLRDLGYNVNSNSADSLCNRYVLHISW